MCQIDRESKYLARFVSGTCPSTAATYLEHEKKTLPPTRNTLKTPLDVLHQVKMCSCSFSWIRSDSYKHDPTSMVFAQLWALPFSSPHVLLSLSSLFPFLCSTLFFFRTSTVNEKLTLPKTLKSCPLQHQFSSAHAQKNTNL